MNFALQTLVELRQEQRAIIQLATARLNDLSDAIVQLAHSSGDEVAAAAALERAKPVVATPSEKHFNQAHHAQVSDGPPNEAMKAVDILLAKQPELAPHAAELRKMAAEATTLAGFYKAYSDFTASVAKVEVPVSEIVAPTQPETGWVREWVEVKPDNGFTIPDPTPREQIPVFIEEQVVTAQENAQPREWEATTPANEAEAEPKKRKRRSNEEIAAEIGVSLDDVREWKGPDGGRIVRADIEEFAKIHANAVQAPAETASATAEAPTASPFPEAAPAPAQAAPFVEPALWAEDEDGFAEPLQGATEMPAAPEGDWDPFGSSSKPF